MAIVSTIDHTAYSPHLLLMSAVLAINLPTKNASVSIILIMNNIFIRSIRVIRVQKTREPTPVSPLTSYILHPFGQPSSSPPGVLPPPAPVWVLSSSVTVFSSVSASVVHESWAPFTAAAMSSPAL